MRTDDSSIREAGAFRRTQYQKRGGWGGCRIRLRDGQASLASDRVKPRRDVESDPYPRGRMYVSLGPAVLNIVDGRLQAGKGWRSRPVRSMEGAIILRRGRPYNPRAREPQFVRVCRVPFVVVDPSSRELRSLVLRACGCRSHHKGNGQKNQL